MGMHQYLSGLNELEMITRAPGYFKYQPHSVAAHSWKVTEAAQFLGDIEEQAGNEIDWRMLYEKALNHDITERFIGDIRTPVKYASATLRQMLADVEDSLSDNFVKTEIPTELQAVYKRRLWRDVFFPSPTRLICCTKHTANYRKVTLSLCSWKFTRKVSPLFSPSAICQVWLISSRRFCQSYWRNNFLDQNSSNVSTSESSTQNREFPV